MTAPLTHRLIPPAKGGNTTVNGRTYVAAVGSAVDAPEFDSTHLQANGWFYLAPSGPTAQRPTSAVGVYPRLPGVSFWDTTVGHMVIWNGANWVSEAGVIS
jgi:hypothetical protein